MEPPATDSKACSQPEFNQTPLICGLPDDIALFCLARVTRRYHTVLKCVSKRWRDLVCSEQWRSYRQKHNLDETWIYALCRDKILDQVCCYVLDPKSGRRCWKLIQGFPACSVKRKGMAFQTLGKKVYLLGGCGWSQDATTEVYCYDASSNTWSEAAPLPTARCGASAVSSHVYVVVYEPLSGTWQHADAVMASGWHGPAVAVDGTLYVLDQSSGTKLMKWQKETQEWVAIGRLSPLLTRPPCQLVAIGKNIFVIGKGLSTVVFDVGNAGNVEGIMLSSSIPNLTSDDDVISCESLSI
ncbi:hypothetical protein Ancab_037033 [Ancistrocladus abbreviatus]